MCVDRAVCGVGGGVSRGVRPLPTSVTPSLCESSTSIAPFSRSSSSCNTDTDTYTGVGAGGRGYKRVSQRGHRGEGGQEGGQITYTMWTGWMRGWMRAGGWVSWWVGKRVDAKGRKEM